MRVLTWVMSMLMETQLLINPFSSLTSIQQNILKVKEEVEQKVIEEKIELKEQTNDTPTPSNVLDINQNIKEQLKQIQLEYPENKILPSYLKGAQSSIREITKKYIGYNSILHQSGVISTHHGCAGWIARIADRIFGKCSYKQIEIKDAQPGDILVSINKNGYATHVMMVIDFPIINKGKTSLSVTDSTLNSKGIYRIHWNNVILVSPRNDYSFDIYRAQQ